MVVELVPEEESYHLSGPGLGFGLKNETGPCQLVFVLASVMDR